ncbi:MAG: response regulator, partial [Planctomycetota bacterium]|nr:response regulator [Planctomycetota bacterium]
MSDVPDKKIQTSKGEPKIPPHVPRLTLFEEATKEAHRHKWIESEKAGRDLGEAAIRDWHKRYWRIFLRERWIEHLQGKAFWVELDNDDFGLLTRKFCHNEALVQKIVERLTAGGENLDVIQWAVNEKINIHDVIEILKILDINARRLSPAISLDESEFVEGIRARHQPRALVVDDDKDATEMLKEILEAEQMECVTAASGEEALEIVQSRRFDLFLIDILLPGKHGAEVAWYLHRHGVTAPIIAISAVLDAWNEDDLYDCGFTHLF